VADGFAVSDDRHGGRGLRRSVQVKKRRPCERRSEGLSASQ
jgi:hypothetical protein